MITVNFIHDSLPVGGLKLRLETAPRAGEGVYLNETSYAVGGVHHVVYADSFEAEQKGLDPHCVYVYLSSAEEYFSQGSWSHRTGHDCKEQ